MARKLFKRMNIEGHKLLASGKLSALGDRIHNPNLWHLNRHSVARAFFAGLFAGFTFLVFPGQMLIAALLAIWLRANLPIAVCLVWITNPLTIPPIIYAAMKVGAVFFPIAVDADLTILLDFEWSVASFKGEMAVVMELIQKVWKPLLFGSLIMGTSLGMTGFLAVQWFWRWHVTRSWNKRQLSRLATCQDRDKQ